MSRWTPWIIGGLMLLGFVERQVNGWSPHSPSGHTAETHAISPGTCLPRDTVLGALTATGATATPEPAPACAASAAPADWYVVAGTPGAAPRHLAFDAAGCLVAGQTDTGASCP